MRTAFLLTVKNFVGPPWKGLPYDLKQLYQKIIQYNVVVKSGQEAGQGIVFGRWVISSLVATGGQRIVNVVFSDKSESIGYVTALDREYQLVKILLACPTSCVPKLTNIFQPQNDKFFNICRSGQHWNMIAHSPLEESEDLSINFSNQLRLCRGFYSSFGIFSVNAHLFGISIGAMHSENGNSSLNFAVAPSSWIPKFLNSG